MNTTLDQKLPFNSSSAVGVTQYRRQFAQITAAGQSMDLKTPEAREAVAAQLVSEMAFKPMLAEMRKFPLAKNDMFSGGRGEEVFGERLDEHLADIVAGKNNGITADIAQRLKPRGTEPAETPDAKAAPPVETPPAAWWQLPASHFDDTAGRVIAAEGDGA